MLINHRYVHGSGGAPLGSRMDMGEGGEAKRGGGDGRAGDLRAAPWARGEDGREWGAREARRPRPRVCARLRLLSLFLPSTSGPLPGSGYFWAASVGGRELEQ
jgi:hypothetical protein